MTGIGCIEARGFEHIAATCGFPIAVEWRRSFPGWSMFVLPAVLQLRAGARGRLNAMPAYVACKRRLPVAWTP